MQWRSGDDGRSLLRSGDPMRCDAMRVGVKGEEEVKERAREGEGRRVELPAKRRSNFFGSRNNSRPSLKPQTK